MTVVSTSDTSVVVAKTLDDLQPHLAELRNLADSAIEPNAFYEPWMLVPALQWLYPPKGLQMVLIFRSGVAGSQPVLIGFFPLEIKNVYNHFPVKTLSLWRHKFCYLCTPLLHRDYAREALGALMTWMESKSSQGEILEFGQVRGEGPVHDLIVERLWTRAKASLVDVRWVRPCMYRASSAQEFLDRSLSSRHQKDLQKKEKKLCQMGKVEYTCPENAVDAGRWTQGFLTMDAKGWRGRRGLAVSSQPSWSKFFQEAMKSAWEAGRLRMIGLALDSRLVAIKINLSCMGGAFAFMITYDEAYSAYSPGLLLEIENIRRFHQDVSSTWMDSCADQNSPLFTRVWSDKRTIETLLMSADSLIGNFWMGAIPLGHFLKRSLMPSPGHTPST
jgi:Acetyltransferase (GNAT) domain